MGVTEKRMVAGQRCWLFER